MAYQAINTGTEAGDGTGDVLRDGAVKVNANFTELYDLLGDGSTLTTGLGVSGSQITLTTPIITEIDSGSTITLDATTDIVLDADSGDIFFKDSGTTFGSATNTSGNLIIKSGTTAAATFSGANVTFAGTVASSGVLTANAGVAVDNITIDGTEIDLSSGDLTIDVAGDIIFNADGGDFTFSDASVDVLRISNSSSDVVIRPLTDAKDIIFQQYDGTEVLKVDDDTNVYVGNDLKLTSDSTVLSFGTDSDVSLTHVHNTGLLLNSTNVIQFNDASQNIGAPSATVLDINATDEIELNATLADVNANLDVSGTYTGGGLMTTGGNIVIPDAGNIGSASSTSAITIASTGIVTFVDDILIKDGGTIGVASAADALTLSSAGLLTVKDDLVIKSGGTIGGAGDTDLLTLGSAVLTVSGAITGTTTINASTSVQTPLIEYTDGDDAMTIADGGGVTFAQAPTFPDGSINIRDLDIDGGTATSTLADADLFIVDDGAGGTNNKITATNVREYMGFGSGTVMLFHQSSAPTGWTKLTSTNSESLADASIRVVGSESFNVGVNGTVAFETAFASKSVAGNIAGNTAATTLQLAQIPSHSHSLPASASTADNKTTGRVPYGGSSSGQNSGATTGNAGSGQSHTHGVGNFAFSGQAIDLDVKFIDVIAASKN